MGAVIENFNFDIFISYRHSDANLDWINEFSEKLKQELNTILKDRLSFYFYNIHTEKVSYQDAEHKLPERLKSLILIPLISKGYCEKDRNVWINEFLAFKKIASGDRFGLNVKNGSNTFSRIIPVKINPIDGNEQTLLEKEIPGSLRTVDFIYSGMEGVYRPLRARDDEMDIKKSSTLYRNQINKTASMIAQVLNSVKAELGYTTTKNPVETKINEEIKKSGSNGALLQPTVFLGWTAGDCKGKRDELGLILQKAGLNVIPHRDCPSDDSEFKDEIENAIKNSSCSVHLLGGQVGDRIIDGEKLPRSLYQINRARKELDNSEKYRIFIWQLPPNFFQNTEPEQKQFINDIRNTIIPRMIYTNVPSPMQLVDDIRTTLTVEEKPVLATEEVEIFFITNQIDETESIEITSMLSDVVQIKSMLISQNRDSNFGEIAVQQIKKSKLAVIYFREASDWAIPFIQQIWKMVGGASSATPMLLIGDDSIEGNEIRKFNAPKVISKIVQKDLIALEIKATYDKVLVGAM